MKAEIELIVYTTLLSAVLSYAWWIKFRVWMLRQDLYILRDQLWDSMRAEGRLDDPEHRRIREAINALIRITPLLSIWTVVRIFIEGPQPDRQDQPTVGGLTSETLKLAARRVNYFLLFESVSGWILLAMMVLISLRVRLPVALARQKFDSLLDRILDSVQIRDESSALAEMPSYASANI